MSNKIKTNTELPQIMGSTLNNRSTTTEPPPKNGQQPNHRGVGVYVNASYWGQTFTLDFVVVKTQTCLACIKASLLMQCIITEKQSTQINTL